MGSRWESCAGVNGLQAATRLFPARRSQISELLERDENFRGLCDDLAAAEQALAAVEDLPDDRRETRRLEYEELVKELALEIEQALDRANIFPISRSPKH